MGDLAPGFCALLSLGTEGT